MVVSSFFAVEAGSNFAVCEILVLAVAYRLRHAILGEHKIVCGEAVNEVALLVLDGNRFHDKVRVDGQGEALRLTRIRILADLLRTRNRGSRKEDGESCQAARHLNLKWVVICRLRMALGAMGSPNCVLVTVLFQLENAAWLKVLVETMAKSR